MRSSLSEWQKRVFYGGETEAPFENAYWNNKHPGLYVDPVSGEVLFSSLDKFDSGTGWPSFSKPVHPELLEYREDFSLGMHRVEVRTRHTKGHLGHVFEDGPPPTGMRFCINSASLRFIPVEDVVSEGYVEYWPLFSFLSLPFEQIILGAGCFWGVEAAFRRVKGVTATAVGYMGGTKDNPTYKEVCTDTTGHAEVVEVTYDPAQVSYEDLLKVFWDIHDPTQLNRQGPDIGTQYRSVIFYHSPEQERAARASLAALEKEKRFRRPIVTQVEPAATFWRAEEYHQQYLEKRGLTNCH
jgi:peptide methionine sulfoxide reductase msrA/msrB